MDDVIKQKWIVRVELTQSIHKEHLRQNIKHRIEDTAKILNRSRSRVADDLMLASWLLTHRTKLEKFKNIQDAIDWVREKRKEMRIA